MCGIAGFTANPNETDWDAHTVATNMLLAIEHRGRDATGLAWWEDDQIWTQKAPGLATKFVPNMEIGSDTRTAILHTRWATIGNPNNNTENHPHQAGTVVLTHNGKIDNHDWLYKTMGVEHTRQATVDSEALAATIAFGSEQDNGHYRLAHNTEAALGHVKGSAAFAWLDTNENERTLHLGRLSGRPLWIARTEAGSLLYGSTPQTLLDGASTLSRVESIDELPTFTTVTFHDGELADMASIPVATTSRPHLAVAS